MAANKKGFVLYADLIHTVSKLPNEMKGKLFQLILDYVNDLNPITNDLLLEVSFEPIKQQLKRDLKHWESVIEKRKIAGAKGGKQKVANASKSKQNVANLTVIDTVTDKVTVIVKDKVNKATKPSLEDFIKYAKEKKPNINIEDVKLKYYSWDENNWCITKDGKNRPILNWKSTLCNTLQYLREDSKKENLTLYPRF